MPEDTNEVRLTLDLSDEERSALKCEEGGEGFSARVRDLKRGVLRKLRDALDQPPEPPGGSVAHEARALLDALDTAEKLAAGGESQQENVNRVLTAATRDLRAALAQQDQAVVTQQEAAERLGVHVNTVAAMLDDGRLEAVEVGNGGGSQRPTRRVAETSIRRLQQDQETITVELTESEARGYLPESSGTVSWATKANADAKLRAALSTPSQQDCGCPKAATGEHLSDCEHSDLLPVPEHVGEGWPPFVVQRFEQDDPIRPYRYVVLDDTQSTDFTNCRRYVPAEPAPGGEEQ